jgi:alkaline phosphatase D
MAGRSFPWGVASFEPRRDAVLLWTRLPPGRTQAQWELAADADFRHVVAEGHERTGADRDHTVCVDATDLAPGTTYWYRFSDEGTRSPVGRTRTLPAPPPGGLRIGYVCCSRYSVAPLGVYRALAEREVDLVVHLGDYIYADDENKGPRRHRPPRPAVTLDDYRKRHAQIREDPDCQALHLRHPMTAIWDDHDFADNAWRGGAKHHDDAHDGPWAARSEAAARARQEWLPARLTDPDEPLRTWRSVPVGDLAELVLLDTRLVGRDLQPGDEGAIARDDPDRSLLGEDQRAWLHERLADTSRPWAIVHSGVVVSELSLGLPAVAAIAPLLPNGYAVVEGRVLHDDQWDGYPAERARVARGMRNRRLSGAATVVVSGDVHSSWAFEGPTDPDVGGDAPAAAVEMTVPASTSVPMARSHLPGLWRVVDRAARRLPHVRWADLTERGYAILDLAADRAVAEWWFVDAFGGDPSGTATSAATFATQRTDRPPRWTPASPTPDPVRPGLAEPLPPRPGDLRQLRRRRRGRRALETVVTFGVAATPAAFLARRLHVNSHAPDGRR